MTTGYNNNPRTERCRVHRTLSAGQCLTGIITSAAAEVADADDHDDAALRYDQRSVRAGRPSARPVRPVRPGNIVVTLNFASMNFTG